MFSISRYTYSIDLCGKLKKCDVAFGISYSGCTKEVVEAIKVAKDSGATTISLSKLG